MRIKNHYVPIFYLKNWVNSNSKVCVYRVLVSHKNVRLWREHSPTAIAYQKHLYTRLVAEVENDEIEEWFGKEVETPAEPIIQKVLNDDKLKPSDWNILIRFLAAQDLRTPARLFEHLQFMDKNLPKIITRTLDKLPEQLKHYKSNQFTKDNEFKDYQDLLPIKLSIENEQSIKSKKIKLESYAGRRTWFFAIKHLLENTYKVLLNHKWTIVSPAKGYSWFTSDNPVVRLNYYGDNKYDLKAGWGRKNGNIILPLGPQHAMFVEIGEKPPLRGIKLDEHLTLLLREVIAKNSQNMIFSSTFDKDIPKIVPRVVNQELFTKVSNEMKNWHHKNITLESEF